MAITRLTNPLKFAGPAILLSISIGISAGLGGQDGQAEFDLLLAKTRQYEARLEGLLKSLEEKCQRARERLITFQQLYSEGLVARIELEAQAQEVERQEEAFNREQHRLHVSRQLELEILASRSPTERPEGARVERFSGERAWELEDLPTLSLYFQNRFGTALPISARGQTDVHTQLGFDHRQGADLALHPDSDAGQAILLYLTQEGIPFIAFRSAVEGAATGAHIHIGRPSDRLQGQ